MSGGGGNHIRLARTILALLLLGSLVGCYPPTQTQYSPAAVGQPMPVHFFYGRLVDVRPATLEYGNGAGIGVAPGFSPYLAGIHLGGEGPAGGVRVSAAFTSLALEGSAPNLPAVEYTVMLDNGTNPPDPYLQPYPSDRRSRPYAYGRQPIPSCGLPPDRQGAGLPPERPDAVIVVQNPNPAEPPLVKGQCVVVRVVGDTGRVMANPLDPVAREWLAGGAMPIPVGAPPEPVAGFSPMAMTPCGFDRPCLGDGTITYQGF